MVEHDTTADAPNATARAAEPEIVDILRNFRRESADSAARQLASLQEIERLLAQLMEA